MNNQPIRVLHLTGDPYEMGLAHGRRYRADIRRYTDERMRLAANGQWTGHVLTRQEVLDVADACLPAHRAYAPDLYAEMEGIAAATDLSLGELVVVGGFTDFVDTLHNYYRMGRPSPVTHALDDCTAFLIPDGRAGGAGFFGQTWDMHDSATEFVILLRVNQPDQPEALVFTTTGCLGQMGMNAAGICIGVNNLMGADGQIGVTWPFVIRKALQQTTIDDALACITDAPLAGAHNYQLFDATGNGYNVEAMSTETFVTPLGETPLIHTNHCLVPQTDAVAQRRPPDLQASSEKRLARATDLLADPDHTVTTDDLIALTRDSEAICVVPTAPRHLASCGAAIMRPRTGDFWAVWGLPSENEYEHFVVD